MPLYFDLGFGIGYTSVSLLGSSENVVLLSRGIGGTLAYEIGDGGFLSVGLSTDYRSFIQHSDLNQNIGNLRGQRWNFAAPTVVIDFHVFLIKLEYQTSGDYALTNTAVDGAEVSYSKLNGFRTTAIVPTKYWLGNKFLDRELHLGLQFEYLSFQNKKDSIHGETILERNLNMWQVGLWVMFVT